MRLTKFAGIGLLAVVILAATGVLSADAASNSTIDFEGLAEGAVVSSVSAGSGISGDDPGGSVTVFGDSADPGIVTNAAIIFDATCAGGCSGGDNDLEKPALGNVLIIAEDLVDTSPADGLIDDPDDADLKNAFFKFDFSGWGSGTVTVNSIDVMDVETVEGGAKIETFSGGEGGTLLATTGIPVTGDNGLATVAVGVGGVDFMRVTLNGSGAIDNISITDTPPPPPPGGEGCTPGFWKNHLDDWAPTGFSPSDSFVAVFGVDLGFATLGDAVNAKGGGVKKLARHGTAALLSAAHPNVDYPFTVGEVILLVQAGDVDPLVDANELGCEVDD